MQVTVLHPRSKAKSVTLTARHLALGIGLFVCAALLFAAPLYFLTLRYAVGLDLPFVRNALVAATQGTQDRQEQQVKEHLAAMAVKLGEMQAQLMRLDALGERVQGLAGIKPQEFSFHEMPGRGGPAPAQSVGLAPLAMMEFQLALDAMARGIEYRADYLNVVETTLMGHKIKSKLLPTTQPAAGSYNASGFGWRMDPFSGRSAFHGGIDFASPTGTPIVAAAGGVVIAAEYHPQYGNVIDIDHGNDIVTRYAHASRLLNKVGDIVRRSQHIADMGSTGRSTGPHLHFEVLVKGVQQDPHKFLAAGADQARLAELAK